MSLLGPNFKFYLFFCIAVAPSTLVFCWRPLFLPYILIYIEGRISSVDSTAATLDACIVYDCICPVMLWLHSLVVAVFTLSFTLWWGASVGYTHRLRYISPCHITECQAATTHNCVYFHLFIDGFARMCVPEKDEASESFVDCCFLHSQKSLLSMQMWRRKTQG